MDQDAKNKLEEYWRERLSKRFRDRCLPEHMEETTLNYILHGYLGGSFITALFSNDLKGAFNCADEKNLASMGRWVNFIYNDVPSSCQGSEKDVQNWNQTQGVIGLAELQENQGA